MFLSPRVRKQGSESYCIFLTPLVFCSFYHHFLGHLTPSLSYQHAFCWDYLCAKALMQLIFITPDPGCKWCWQAGYVSMLHGETPWQKSKNMQFWTAALCEDGTRAILDHTAVYMGKDTKRWTCNMTVHSNVTSKVGHMKDFDLCTAECTTYCDAPAWVILCGRFGADRLNAPYPYSLEGGPDPAGKSVNVSIFQI
jgi:hypothetical protein